MNQIQVIDRLPSRELLSFPAFSTVLDPRAGTKNLLANYATRRMLGLVPGVFGGAAPLQGYNTEADVIRQTADGMDTNLLWQEFQALLTRLNAQRQPIVDLVSYTVPRDIERVPQVGSNAGFERASEFGLPKAIRTDVDYFNMGFAFDWFDTGVRYTWRFLAEADAAQVTSTNIAIIEADNRLMFQTVMWTLFNNTNRTAEIQGNPYTVYSFYNGTDSVVPPPYRTNTFNSSHTHYLVSGAATVDSGDLDEQITHLSHHGYSRANGYEIVMLVNEQELNTIRTFKSVQNGGTAKYDFIPALGTPNFLLPENFIVNTDGGGSRPASTYRGIAVAGRYGDALILNDDYFPAGYLVSFATGGPENINNPIGIREHARQEYRGLRLIKGRAPDYPLQESYYLRGFGTGVRHRGAGVVTQIKASGSYALPTMYATRP